VSDGSDLMQIRRAHPDELARVRALVQTVVDEVYGGMWAPPPLPIGDDDWSLAWLAVDGDGVQGVALTREDWLEDLWVARDWRDRGVGARLLTTAEREIAARGHRSARLSVIALNTAARRFYARHGWTEGRSYLSAVDPVEKIEMSKLVD
jgi:GNAT superfamily N-acetyltransferase